MSIERISTNFAGSQSEGSASGADLSSTGRYVVYVSDARDIVGGQAASGAGVYIRDMETGKVERIDRAVDGGPVNGSAYNAKVSGDGRYVTYTSTASNLVAGAADNNGEADVFVYDRLTQTTRLISTNADGSAASGGSYVAGISNNGRYIAYVSEANDILVTSSADGELEDRNTQYGSTDLFVYDMVTGETRRESYLPDDLLGTPGVHVRIDEVSTIHDMGYAQYSAYWTAASGVTLRQSHPSDAHRAIIWSDSSTWGSSTSTTVKWGHEGRTLTVKYAGEEGYGTVIVGAGFENDVSSVTMAANGRFVVYTAAFDQNGNYNGGHSLYLYDALTHQTVVLALATEGDPFKNIQISADGSWITFETDQPLTDDDDNGKSDVFRVANPFGSVGNGGEGDFPDGDHWILGTNDDDELLGTEANDHISALEGDDIVEGLEGDDTITGAGGVDWLYGGGGVDHLSGGDGDDRIHGDASIDSSHGNGGSFPSDNVDHIDGGAGNDTIYGNGGGDHLHGGTGWDHIYGGDGEDFIYGGRNEIGSDWLSGGGQGDIIHGDDGDDAVGDSDIIMGGDGRDFLFGDGGNDTLFGDADADLLSGGDGKDALFGGRNLIGRDELFGGEGDDTLYGDGEVDDFLNDGGDDLDGGAGSDVLHGGGGHDVLIGGANEGDKDRLFGGSGDDTLYGDRKTRDPDDVAADDGLDIIYGQAGADTIYGNGGTDELWGGLDEDTIYGGEGEDWLFGEQATLFDTLFGGAGNDHIYGDLATLDSDLKWVGSDTAHDSNDLIFGGEGNDIIYAGGKNDEVWGEEGGDFISGQSGYDVLIGGAGGGTDGLFGGQGRDVLIGDGAYRDEDLNFVAVESDADDNDIIHGESGSDEIYGGGGDDLLEGGSENDFIVGGSGSDTINGGDDDDVIFADGPTASALHRSAARMSAGADRDILDGGAGNDTLYAGLGSRLIGGTGSDTFVLGINSAGSVIEDLTTGAGGDLISLVGVLDGVTANWDGETNLFATGHLKLEARGVDTVLLFDADGAAGSGEAVELAAFTAVAPTALTGANMVIGDYGHVIIDPTRTSVIQGTDSADTLVGTEGNDTIVGLFGDDVIRGRGGDDDLSGGYGSDTLFGEGGNDLLRGGFFDDLLDGGDGDDVLIGGDGDDTLAGGSGNDTLYLDTGSDTASGGGGNDTFVASRYFSREDVILDFDAGVGAGDIIDLTQLSDVHSLQQLRAYLSTDANGDVRIAMDSRTGSYITLKGVKPEDLAADDFRFAPDPNNPDPVNQAPRAISIDGGTVSENAPAGTVVGVVSAVDPDGDAVTYLLADDAGGRFSIDATTGVVTTNAGFDHEAEESISLVVRATDAGGLYIERTLVIQIGDVNETPHSIAMDHAVVAENAAAGTAVGTVTAADPDGDALVYSLVDDADGLFVIDPDTGVVTTTRPFDHETEAAFDIVVRATDAGGLFVDHHQTVTVGDVNEAPATIALDGARVKENAAAGAVVGTASAEDPKDDALVFSLTDDAQGRFRIDPATGRITTTRALDHEATPSLRIVIRATDAAGAWVDREAAIVVEDVKEGPVGTNDGPLQIDEDATSANLWSLLLANDAGGAGLSIASVNTTGTKGSIVFDAATRTLKYVADADAFDLLTTDATATDSFTYTVTDASGETSTATVTFTVRGVADGRVIKGGNGKDTLTGTAGEDVITGENGNDILYGLDGADRLDGGNGTDKLYGGAGIDTLVGGNGDDLLDGGAGNDSLNGGLGQDQLLGGAGDDFILGGGGNDLLTGGAGADTIVFGIASDIDKILDFEVGKDRLEFTQGVQVLFHEIGDNNNDGVLDTVLVTNLGGVIIMLGVEYPVGPSLEDYLRPVWERSSPHGLLIEPHEPMLC